MARKGITQEQIKEIQKLVRRANRRIERASGGQLRYLESVVRRATGGQTKFSAAYKGLSETEAKHKIEKLEDFLGAMSTTRVGWDWIKKEIVHKTGEKLSKMGYTLTDEEIADILQQVDGKSSVDYYRAINLVQAAKWDVEDREYNYQEIADIIGEKASAQEALKKAIKARKERINLSLGVMKGKNPRKTK